MDATDPAEVAAAATGQDVIVSAIGPRRGVDDQEAVLVGGARGLIAGARSAGVRRVIVVGGGGSLLVASGERLLSISDFPAAWRPGALAQAAALELYLVAGDLDWTYISPPFLIEAGERSGRFRLGGDEVLRDPQGVSRITYPDFAIALVDELEQGRARPAGGSPSPTDRQSRPAPRPPTRLRAPARMERGQPGDVRLGEVGEEGEVVVLPRKRTCSSTSSVKKPACWMTTPASSPSSRTTSCTVPSRPAAGPEHHVLAAMDLQLVELLVRLLHHVGREPGLSRVGHQQPAGIPGARPARSGR